jgi:hypothetical protein
MPAQMVAPGQYGREGRLSSTRPHPLLLIGLAMLAFVIVLLLVTHSRPGAPAPAPASVPTSGVEGEASTSSGVPPEVAPPSTGAQPAATQPTATAGGDPLEEAARRAINREAPNVGLPPPAITSPDGQVHLRTGGSISPEEWNAARAKLKESPLLRDPPAPPPF